jgi:hypothetical protein
MNIFPEKEYTAIQQAMIGAVGTITTNISDELHKFSVLPAGLFILSSLPENRDAPFVAHDVSEFFSPEMESFKRTGLKMVLMSERAVFYLLVSEGWTLPQERLDALRDGDDIKPHGRFENEPDRISTLQISGESIFGDRLFVSYVIDEDNNRSFAPLYPTTAICFNEDEPGKDRMEGNLLNLLPRFKTPDASPDPVH